MPIYKRSIQLESSKISQIFNVAHAYSLRFQGDMRDRSFVSGFLHQVGVSQSIYLPKQIHGDVVVINPSIGSIEKADGIVITRDNKRLRSVGVLTADCVSVLFSDRSGSVIGAVHAGWRGALGSIIHRMLEAYRSLGIQKKDMVISIGPHIGSCCYSVDVGRIQLFKKAYKDHENYCYQVDSIWYLDIGKIILMQLLEKGIDLDQIDYGVNCTSCQNNAFFSFRKDSKDSFGEMISCIGFKGAEI